MVFAQHLFKIENFFLRLYSLSIIHYNHLCYRQYLKKGRRSRKLLRHSGIRNLGRFEIGYKFKGQVINRVRKLHADFGLKQGKRWKRAAKPAKFS